MVMVFAVMIYPWHRPVASRNWPPWHSC